MSNSKSEAFPWRPKLTRFINVACTIWPKIGLGARDVNGQDLDETETPASQDETLTMLVRLKTEMSRPRPQPCYVAQSLKVLEKYKICIAKQL